MTAPLITVGIPTFNSARTLRRAVASVLAQSEARWVLRLSDDASDDETWAICETLAGTDPRISAVRQPVRRMYLNFGDLAAAATTPYFVWLAADDHWAPEFLARCLTVIAARPEVVSVLPGCAFIGADPAEPAPDTTALDGPRRDRLRRYLAHPGGTRMYGLARTEAVRRAFPAHNMNAYDWFLMIGLLGEGAQAGVDETLLYREQSDWMNYVEIVDSLYRGRLWRRFPVLEMSLRALRAGRVPLANLGDLARLNLRKHEEYLAVTRPQDYARRAWLFRLLGLPLSSRPGKLAAIASRLIRRDPARRDGAAEVLRRGMARGDATMAMALGRARRDGLVPGDPAACFAAAAAAGDPDGAFCHAMLGASGGAPDTATWAGILAAAHGGSAGGAGLCGGRTSRRPGARRDRRGGRQPAGWARARGRDAMSRAALPPLTAVLTCRNAAGTLPRLLDHLQRAGATVVLIDHGSTDDTHAIAAARRGAPVADLIRAPFDGTFDLTEQLRLKARVIGAVGSGWVLHADADEFLDAPAGATLRAFAGRWDAEGRIAIPCLEFLFLPATEAETHRPADFEDSLATYVHLTERDPKQRLFRHDAPLDLWMATGGHTITRDPALIAPEPVNLRHYLGLSLDDIRAQYYGRVFAARDLAKRWHGRRRTGVGHRIAAPPAGVLKDRRTEGLEVSVTCILPPVFVAIPAGPARPPDQIADLLVVAAPSEGSDSILGAIEEQFPGLRVTCVADADSLPAGRVPGAGAASGRASGHAGGGLPRPRSAAGDGGRLGPAGGLGAADGAWPRGRVPGTSGRGCGPRAGAGGGGEGADPRQRDARCRRVPGRGPGRRGGGRYRSGRGDRRSARPRPRLPPRPAGSGRCRGRLGPGGEVVAGEIGAGRKAARATPVERDPLQRQVSRPVPDLLQGGPGDVAHRFPAHEEARVGLALAVHQHEPRRHVAAARRDRPQAIEEIGHDMRHQRLGQDPDPAGPGIGPQPGKPRRHPVAVRGREDPGAVVAARAGDFGLEGLERHLVDAKVAGQVDDMLGAVERRPHQHGGQADRDAMRPCPTGAGDGAGEDPGTAERIVNIGGSVDADMQPHAGDRGERREVPRQQHPVRHDLLPREAEVVGGAQQGDEILPHEVLGAAGHEGGRPQGAGRGEEFEGLVMGDAVAPAAPDVAHLAGQVALVGQFDRQFVQPPGQRVARRPGPRR